MTEPPRTRPDATVVICTHNRAADLARVLDDLSRQDAPAGVGWDILVVDNNSTDDTREVVERRARLGPVPVRYAFEPRQGKSHALNHGIATTAAPVLLFTDDDVRIPPTWLGAMLAPFTNPRCMGVGGRVRPEWLGPIPPWASESEPYRMMAAIVQYAPQETGGPTAVPPIGANAAWRRELFERHGPFRSDLGPAGSGSSLGEDTEFGQRMITLGEEVWYAPEAVLHHPVAPERLNRSYFLEWYRDSGRFEPFRAGAPPGVRIAGIPRYLFRELVEAAAAWLTAFNPVRRFYYKLRTWQTLGRMRGFRDAAAARGPLAPGPLRERR